MVLSPHDPNFSKSTEAIDTKEEKISLPLVKYVPWQSLLLKIYTNQGDTALTLANKKASYIHT